MIPQGKATSAHSKRWPRVRPRTYFITELSDAGALVFVDEMYVPHPRKFVHDEHVIVYDNSDPIDFARKLLFYLEHPTEARRIAANGLRHALAYHRAVSRMDFVLRSAHEMASAGRASSYSFTAKQIAYDVNATTQVSPVVNISDPAINVQNIDPHRNIGRRYRTSPLSSQVLTELIERNQKRRHNVGMGVSARHQS